VTFLLHDSNSKRSSSRMYIQRQRSIANSVNDMNVYILNTVLSITARWRRKVAGSIPDGVIGNFHWHNASGRTVALGSTQPLTEMSTRNISWGVKAAGALGWQPYHFHVPTVLKSGSLKCLEPSGSVLACNGLAFFTVSYWQLLSVTDNTRRSTVVCKPTRQHGDFPFEWKS